MKNLLRILTFNLKNDTLLTANKNRWSNRYPYIKCILSTLDYDILGVQELTANHTDALKNILTDYHCVGLSRNKKHDKNDELSAIFFKKDRFNCVSEKTLWLSNTPSNKGSKVLLSIYPRICTIVHLHDKLSGQHFLVVNTHLDHLLTTTRKAQIKKLIAIIQNYYATNDYYLIVMGDFNTSLSSAAIKLLISSNLQLQPIYGKQYSNTLHRFSGKANPNKKPIDHIFFDRRLTLVDYEIITENFNGQYPSDHYPVHATLHIKDRQN